MKIKNTIHISVYAIGAILFVAGFLRLWQLGQVPVSMSDDETRLVYSAYSIWKTGKDIFGNAFPLAFLFSGYAFNPVPVYITSPFVGVFGLTMFMARLPFALAGIASVFLVFYIARRLFQHKAIALLSALVLTFSVWHIQLSRFAYEGTMALFWYLLGVFLFLGVQKKNYFLLVASLLCFTFGFYSYSGYKVTFLPIILTLIWYKWKVLNIKQYILIVFVCLFAFGSLVYLGKTQGAMQYGGTLFFFQDKTAMETTIELERRASMAPEIVKRLYHNKFTYIWNIFIRRYQYAFSSQYLFSDQESSGIFSMWGRGQMYYIDAIFLSLGAMYLFVKKRKEFVLFLACLAASPLASAFGPEPVNYTVRASFMLPWLSILAGSGIYSMQLLIRNKYIKIIIYGGIILMYSYAVIGYLSQYYYDWSRLNAKYYSNADRDLSQFLLKEKRNRLQIMIYDVQQMTFLHYAFYSQMSPQTVQMNGGQIPIVSENITIYPACADISKLNSWVGIPVNSLIISTPGCVANQQKFFDQKIPYTIITSPEGHDEWFVYAP